MYFYFYDKFVQDKKYEVVVTKIETKLLELGINGRIEKLSLFKNARELINSGIKMGAHTVVAVGNDATLCSLVNIIAGRNITLGFIPVTEHSFFSKILGIPVGEEACLILSRRLTCTVDLGRILNFHFLGSLELPKHTKLKLRCDNNYTISATERTSTLSIMNIGRIMAVQNFNEMQLANGRDGKLEIIISPLEDKTFFHRRQPLAISRFFTKQITISTEGGEKTEVIADEVGKFSTPCEVKIIPRALKIVVGRDRILQ